MLLHVIQQVGKHSLSVIEAAVLQFIFSSAVTVTNTEL